MIKTNLLQSENRFTGKVVCPFTSELKSIRNQVQELSDEYGHYSTSLQISVAGQAVMYHVKAYNIQLQKTVEVVANNLEDLETKLRISLQELKDQSPVICFFNHLFSTMHKPI